MKMGTEKQSADKMLSRTKDEIGKMIEDMAETMGGSAYEMALEIVERSLDNVMSNCKRTATEITENDMCRETGVILSSADSHLNFLGKVYSEVATSKNVCGELISCMMRKIDKLERENRELKKRLESRNMAAEKKRSPSCPSCFGKISIGSKTCEECQYSYSCMVQRAKESNE